MIFCQCGGACVVGVSFRGVSVFSQSNVRREVGGRGRSSHTTLSQLQHAFVQTQKSDRRVLQRCTFMLLTKWVYKTFTTTVSLLSGRIQLDVFLTHSASFGSWICFCFVLWSCEVVQTRTARCRERRSPGRGEDFPWTGSLSVLLEYDCCHVHLVDVSPVLWQKGESKLMLPFILLAGYLWRGCPVCSHAALGVTCGRDNTVSVEFTDLDSRRGHT